MSNSKLETNQPASLIKPSYITKEVQAGRKFVVNFIQYLFNSIRYLPTYLLVRFFLILIIMVI